MYLFVLFTKKIVASIFVCDKKCNKTSATIALSKEFSNQIQRYRAVNTEILYIEMYILYIEMNIEVLYRNKKGKTDKK